MSMGIIWKPKKSIGAECASVFARLRSEKNKLERKTFDLEVEEKCRNIEKMAKSLFDVGSCDPFLSAEAQYLSSVFAPSRLRRYRRMIEAKVPTDKLMNDIDENEVLWRLPIGFALSEGKQREGGQHFVSSYRQHRHQQSRR